MSCTTPLKSAGAASKCVNDFCMNFFHHLPKASQIPTSSSTILFCNKWTWLDLAKKEGSKERVEQHTAMSGGWRSLAQDTFAGRKVIVYELRVLCLLGRVTGCRSTTVKGTERNREYQGALEQKICARKRRRETTITTDSRTNKVQKNPHLQWSNEFKKRLMIQ